MFDVRGLHDNRSRRKVKGDTCSLGGEIDHCTDRLV